MQINIALPPQILNSDGKVIEHSYRQMGDDGIVPTGNVLLNLDQLSLLAAVSGKRGVLVSRSYVAEPMGLPLTNLDLIAVYFDTFTDGRGYSLAAHLRREGFKGDLWAVGDVFKDVLFYLKRSGFNGFALKQDKSLAEAAPGLNDFSSAYQASVTSTVMHYQTGQALKR